VFIKCYQCGGETLVPVVKHCVSDSSANKCNIELMFVCTHERTLNVERHPNENMPPFAAQYDHSSSQSDNDDTPESIPLSQSKKDIQKLEADRRIAEAIQQKARKEKNRELDRKLKERSVINKDTGNRPSKRRKSTIEEEDSLEHPESSDGRNKANVAEERMKRAIQEAEDEDRGSFTGDDEEHSDEEDDSVSEAKANVDHTIPDAKRLKTMRKPHHLPDGLFEAAFSSKAMKRKVEEDGVPLDRPPKKRRSSKSKSKKDIVVG